MRRLYFSGLFLLLLCNAAGSCFAQLSPYEHPNKAPEAIAPLFSLVSSLNNIMLGNDGMDQKWDSVEQHFRGNILGYLYYPGMTRPGYRSFSVLKIQVYNSWAGLSAPEALKNKLDEIRQQVQKDNGRKKIQYYYDTSGWLRAVVETSINPQFQGFYEKSDSLDYTFREDGSALISWLIKEHSSGSGYAGTIECGDLTTGIHQIYKRSDNKIVLDKWHNIISIETLSRETWDSCNNGGPKYWKKEIDYDSTGRVSRIIDSNGSYASRYSESSFEYHKLPFSRFLDSVKDMPEYRSLKLPVISKWLRRQSPLTYLGVSKTSKWYARYDPKINSDVIYPDSPTVRQDVALYVVNKNKQRVIAWNNKEASWLKKDAFALYSYGTNTQKHVSVKEIQFLPYKISDKDTFQLTSAIFAFTDTIRIGSYEITSFKTGEKGPYRPPVHSSYRGGDVVRIIDDDGAPPLYFRPSPALVPFGSKKKMVWTENDLVRYLWTDDYVYQLTYSKNEP